MTFKEESFLTLVKAMKIAQVVKIRIQTMIDYLLVTHFSTFICLLVTTLLRLPLPFSLSQLLFLHLVIDSLSVILMSSKIATHHPNHKNNLVRMISKGTLIFILTMMTYFIGIQESSELAMMLTFGTICVIRLGHTLNYHQTNSYKRDGQIFLIGLFFLNLLLIVMNMRIQLLIWINILGILPILIIQVFKRWNV